MNVKEEIARIRAEVSGVERTLARVSMRLDQMEARQRALDSEGVAESGVTAKKTAATPPPLPPRVAEMWTPPIPSTEETIPAPTMPAPQKTPEPVPLKPAARKPIAPARKRLRIGPPEGMSWEMALGTYWLPRIGMPIIAMAVVYGFTWVAGQFKDAAWMPYARVGIGFSISAGLLGIGWRLEKKYAAYARILMGGGLGVLYFVVFATWYIPQTRIAPSQEFTLVCLGLLVAGWGAIAQWRKSQLVALSMTLLGHFTVALSTLTLETPSRAAVGGLLVLGIGSAWFLYRNGWYAVALSAMAGSYLNQFLWLSRAPAGGGVLEFSMGMAVLAAYLATFAAAERLTPVAFAAGRPRVRNIYCGLNTGGFVLLGVALIQGFAFARPYDFLLYFATALFAGGMGWSYAQREVGGFDLYYRPTGDAEPGSADSGQNAAGTGDPLSAIYFTKASVLAAMGFAAWLDGPAVTLSLALESLALLLAARRSRRPIGRVLALGSAALAFAHGMYTLAAEPFPAFGEPDFYGYGLATLATAVVLWAVAELYRVTSWQTFATRPYTGPAFLEPLCRDLEMLPSEPGAPPRPSRMALAHLLVGFGVLLLAGAVAELVTQPWRAPLMGFFGLAVAAAGLARRSAPLLSGSVFLAGIGALVWLGELYGLQPPEGNLLMLGAVCVIPLWTASELLRQLGPSRLRPYEHFDDIQGAWRRNTDLMANLYGAAAAALTGATVFEGLAAEPGLLLLGALTLAACVYAAATGAANIGLYACLVAFCAVVPAASLHASAGEPWMAVAGLVLLGAGATSVEERWWGPRVGLAFQRLLPAPYLLYGVFAWSGLWLVDRLFPDAVQPGAVAVLAMLLALAMPWLHARAMATWSTALVAVATLVWLGERPGTLPVGWWHASAAVLVGLSLAGDRYFTARKPFAQPWPGRVLLFCAWIACTGYNREMAHGGWQYTGSAAIALGFLGYGGLFRSGTAALLSLAGAVMATVPLLLNASSRMELVALCAAYVSLIVYWLCVERGVAIVLKRTRFKLVEGHETAIGLGLAGVTALLGVLCLARIETIHDFYLTLSWTVWALAIFCWALVTRQPWFRYAGLATFGLALGRAFLLDVWKLEGLYRAGALMTLGAALLAVAYGYIRWRASQDTGTEAEDKEP